MGSETIATIVNHCNFSGGPFGLIVKGLNMRMVADPVLYIQDFILWK